MVSVNGQHVPQAVHVAVVTPAQQRAVRDAADDALHKALAEPGRLRLLGKEWHALALANLLPDLSRLGKFFLGNVSRCGCAGAQRRTLHVGVPDRKALDREADVERSAIVPTSCAADEQRHQIVSAGGFAAHEIDTVAVQELLNLAEAVCRVVQHLVPRPFTEEAVHHQEVLEREPSALLVLRDSAHGILI